MLNSHLGQTDAKGSFKGSYIFPSQDESHFDILKWISIQKLKVVYILPNLQHLH